MDIAELKKLLKTGEWNDVEFKEARSDVPKSAYETVSAFANTHGGHLVFGVSESNNRYEISGVERADKLQNDFLSTLHAGAKVNHDVQIEEQKLNIEGRVVLVFHIEENRRTRKPVYLDGDIRRTFLRKGGGDYKAQMLDIERMLRDSNEDRWDGQPFLKIPFKEAFDLASLRWYRDKFFQVNAGLNTLQSNTEFLHHWGFLLRDGKKYIPTRGSIMLFGSSVAIHHIIPRPTLDVQFLGYPMNDPLPKTRWIDRLICEDNIIQTWEQLLAKYRFFMPKPFRDIDPVTLGRRDDPPSFRVFREAVINLLIHQDYGDHSRKAVVKFFRDGIQFWNPGDVFGDDSQLWEPMEKEVRNPLIAMAMRRIAMCEQAGTGLRMMRDEWVELGHKKPTCNNDRKNKAFELFLPDLDKDIDMASDLAQAMFADTANRLSQPSKSNSQKRTTTTSTSDNEDDRLSQPSKSTVQVKKILEVLRGKEMSASEIAETMGIKHRQSLRENYLRPALQAGVIEYTLPDKPNSRLQKYRIASPR